MLYSGNGDAAARLFAEIDRIAPGAGLIPPSPRASTWSAPGAMRSISAKRRAAASSPRSIASRPAPGAHRPHRHRAHPRGPRRPGRPRRRRRAGAGPAPGRPAQLRERRRPAIRGACTTLCNIGYAHATMGAYVEAEEALCRAHASAERMGLGTVAPFALHNLGGVLHRLGRLDEARATPRKRGRARCFERAKDPRLEGAPLSTSTSPRILAHRRRPGRRPRPRPAAPPRPPASPPPLRAGALAALAQALLAVPAASPRRSPPRPRPTRR